MERPLNPVFLKYAADDIRRIAALYTRFLDLGYLKQSKLPTLLERSNRYDTDCRLRGRPDQQDKFRFNPYLPLGSLEGPVSAESSSQCTKCFRRLSISHFPYNATRKEVWDGKYIVVRSRLRTSICKICTLIIARGK